MATMKALRLTRETPGTAPVLTLEDLPKPDLKPDHLVVKVHASAIHPSDIINFKGAFPYTTFPRVPGRDYAGVVVEGPEELIGKEVCSTSGNTQAFSVDGAQAQFIMVPIASVAPKPKTLSFVQAATIGVPFTTASLALRKAGAKAGDFILVLGANGAVGSATVQLAKSMGAKVLSGARNDSGDVNTALDPELNALDALTEGKGVDIIIDTVGMPSLTSASVKKLARGGRLAFIAAPRSGSTDLGIEMVDFYRKEKTLIGCNTLLYSVEELAKELTGMVSKFESGVLQGSKPGEWKEMTLEDGVAAYEKASQRTGKFVIVMN
jgi:NADPH2:quinone reductase